MFPSRHHVVFGLLTYTDWWQPATTSLLHVPGRDTSASDGFRSGLLETLDQRTELRRRVWNLEERDRRLLFLWYVQQLTMEEISREVGLSRRQCFRRRAEAVRALVDVDRSDVA